MRDFKKIKQNNGVSLIEVLVAVSVFAVSATTIIFLLIDGTHASGRSLQATQAILLAQEGLEAIQSISDNDFDNASVGVHGISISSGVWALSGSSDTQGVFTRSITVAGVDDDTKEIESEVTWSESTSRPGSVVVVGNIYDWRQTHGISGDLYVDALSATLASSSMRLEGVWLSNTGGSTITIDQMRLQWYGDALLYEIKIGSLVVFSVPQPNGMSSGVDIDITDYNLTTLSGTTSLEFVKFTEAVGGTEMIMTFIMSDGSTHYNFIEF